MDLGQLYSVKCSFPRLSPSFPSFPRTYHLGTGRGTSSNRRKEAQFPISRTLHTRLLPSECSNHHSCTNSCSCISFLFLKVFWCADRYMCWKLGVSASRRDDIDDRDGSMTVSIPSLHFAAGFAPRAVPASCVHADVLLLLISSL